MLWIGLGAVGAEEGAEELAVVRYLLMQQFVNNGFGRNRAGWRSSSVSKVRRPRDEQLAHLRLIGRRRTSRGLTPIRLAQASTSALKTLAPTGRCEKL